jgi:hypothetical protein
MTMDETAAGASSSTKIVPALVFGASGEQGRAVLEGLVDSPFFDPVYGFSSSLTSSSSGSTAATATNGNNGHGLSSSSTIDDNNNKKYLVDALGVTLLEGRLNDPEAIKNTLITTKAQAIFLATTFEMPIEMDLSTTSGGYRAAEDEEYQTIVQFFDVLKRLHKEEQDSSSGGGLKRTVVFSTHDNVHEYVREKQQSVDETSSSSSQQVWIEPLDDGSIVPHYSGKGRGGMEAQRMLQDVEGLNLTQLTMPFFYSNFLAFFCPLPNNDKQIQWELSGSFGDGSNVIDMMSVSDMSPLVGKFVGVLMVLLFLFAGVVLLYSINLDFSCII